MEFSYKTLLLLVFFSFVFVANSIAEESPTRESYIPERRKSWNSYEKQFQANEDCAACGPGLTDCCYKTNVPEEGSAFCDQMIPSAEVEPSEGDDFNLDCNHNNACRVTRCIWTLPNGRICDFQTSLVGTVCLQDSTVTLVGNMSLSTGGSCTIRVSSANAAYHDGVWTCLASNVVPYKDRVTVIVYNGLADIPVTLSAGVIMGITIPIGIILIIAIVIVIICCCCPNCCPGCRRQSSNDDGDDSGCCGLRKKKGNNQSHYAEPRRTTATSPSALPPAPRIIRESHQQLQPQIPSRPSYNRDTYEIEEEEGTDSSFTVETGGPRMFPGQRKTGYQPDRHSVSPPEPVVYTHVRTESGLLHPGAHQPKTARKISNTTSLHSFSVGQQQNKGKKTSVI